MDLKNQIQKRKLKFRYWNPIAKTYKMSWRYSLTHDGKILAYDVDMMGYDEPTDPKDSALVIQQWTGLKDKNGVEIYEGDIVKVYSEEFENENFTGKVIFDEGSFLTWINKNDIRGVWSGDNIEVIGNIMENPELLKV
jgi:hypothetical protein